MNRRANTTELSTATRTPKGVAEMPLVDITLKPNYRAPLIVGLLGGESAITETDTRDMVKIRFAQAVPHILVDNAEELGLDLDMPPEGVQVQNHDYGEFDVNVADIWIKLQFSEHLPTEAECLRTCNVLYELFKRWFVTHGFIPEIVIDILWGPTHGKGVVNGVKIKW